MNFKNALLVILASIFLQACTPTGPVKFYEGATMPPAQIARVKVPGPITMLEIDGRKIQSPFKEEGFYELHLPPGAHRLTFKYKHYWGSDVSGMIIKSEPTEINHNFAAGKVYELVYEEPASEDEAFILANDFQVSLVEADGSARVVSHSLDERPVLPTVVTPTPDAQEAIPASAEERLLRIDALHKKGLISDDERRTLRQKVLDTL